MTDLDDKFAVALTRCYYCGESNEIILNRKLTKPMAAKVKEVDGKVLTMNPCTKCEEYMKEGVILITIDPYKSDAGWEKEAMPNPFRTGGFFVIKDDAFKDMINDSGLVEWGLDKRWMFIEHEVGVMWGLFEFAEKTGGGDEP